MTRTAHSLVCMISLAWSLTSSAAPQGWVCFAGTDGHVYRVEVGGDIEELTGNEGAKHACWSYDGSVIFFIKGNGDIYAMNNEGGDLRKIGTADGMNYSPIAAYRPGNKSVLCVDGDAFYSIDAVSEDKTKVCDAGTSVAGETAISRDGNRLAFRAGDNNLYQLEKGGSPEKYAGRCSASLSPGGDYLTENGSGHDHLFVYNWDGGSERIDIDVVDSWDNQSFAANSDRWICAVGDNSVGANQGSECVVLDRSSGDVFLVDDWNSPDTKYPRYFHGDLPPVEVTEDTTPPTAPSNFRNTASTNTSLSFAWDEATDDESGIVEYRLFFDGTRKAATDKTSATVTGLTKDTQYSNIHVVAVNGVDVPSESSNAIDARTADETVRAEMFRLCAARDAASLSNGMQEATESGSTCDNVVFAGSDGGNTDFSTADSRAEYTITVAGGEWYLWVRTKFTSDGGNSWWVSVDGNQLSDRLCNQPPLAGTTDQWHWEGNLMEAPFALGNLSEGSHTIAVYAREAADDNYLDQLCFTPDPSYEPMEPTAATPPIPAANIVSRPWDGNTAIYTIRGRHAATGLNGTVRTRRGASVYLVVNRRGEGRRIVRVRHQAEWE